MGPKLRQRTINVASHTVCRGSGRPGHAIPVVEGPYDLAEDGRGRLPALLAWFKVVPHCDSDVPLVSCPLQCHSKVD